MRKADKLPMRYGAWLYLIILLVGCAHAPPAPVVTLGNGRSAASLGLTVDRFCASTRFAAVKIEGAGPEITCHAILEYEHLLDSLQAILPEKLTLTTLLLLPRQPRMGLYDPRYGKIELEDRTPGAPVLSRNEAILVHEEGHNLFHGFLSEEIPLYGELAKLNEENGRRLSEMLELAQSYGGVEACQVETSECYRKVSLKNAASVSAEAKLHAFLQQNKAALDSLGQRVAPLHELYADLVAALFYDDASAMIKKIPDLGACRVFKAEPAEPSPPPSAYCELRALRAPLWERFVFSRLGDKRALLRELGRAFAEEAKKRAQEKLPSPQRSIRRLKAALKI
ncbi:MAG: hypothetical protein EOP11_06930 [Proteobacteria bacterium]|nr:MAG: hypothetical protein EOP11_06930 [Pseudomonadota bacterium]